MTSDTLMAANLGYMLTIMYNPNNCAYEGSPATTGLEIEVGKQLAKMLGYDPEKSWGHITSGGTVANYEGIWVARNLKLIPYAIKEVSPELVEGLSDWNLMNLTVKTILDMLDEVKKAGKFEEVINRSVRVRGFANHDVGKMLIPQSKHYSWSKGADILGIGQENIVYIQVKDDFRMDIDSLRHEIDRLVADKTPIFSVVSVVGTTEEGAIDEVHKVIALREEYEKQGVSFYIHVDAAYGGYGRSIFIDENGAFIPYNDIHKVLYDNKIISEDIDWPERDIYDAFRAMSEADSITIDPHKMGYIPYAAGAIVMKDRRILDLIAYYASYVFEKDDESAIQLGSYIMEGSKAGAVVAAVWMAHKVVPLNISGYGRIIGCSIEGAQKFYNSMSNTIPLEINGRKFVVRALYQPDFNLIDFAFNEEGNSDLTVMNDLNRMIYEKCSYKSGPVYINDFITSKTVLKSEEYKDAPKDYVISQGIDAAEWDRVGELYVLRASIMTPFLVNNTTYEKYWDNFIKSMYNAIRLIINQQ